jgi:murein DD-endopeptidase MepM/ murein hydrolase activator NlpD
VNKKYLILLTFLVLALIFFLFSLRYKKNTDIKFIPVIAPTVEPTKVIDKVYPIADFRQRITKKPFGIYVTPKNSPVQPERFSGFHTGVDVEYEDVKEDVSVVAVCDGEIVLSRWVSGYGGTIGLKCQINKSDYYLIYGHLRTSSLTKKTKVLKGDQIAVLGNGNTQETDFERKHLHFSIHKNTLDLRGYVQNQNELKNWIDPLTTNLFY